MQPMNPSVSKKAKRPFILGLVTGARSDFGIWQSIIEALARSEDFCLQILSTGWYPRNEIAEYLIGHDVSFVEIKSLSIPPPGDTLEEMGVSMVETSRQFLRLFTETRPHAVMVLGDRYETFAAAQAAFCHRIPLIHFHGGETTEGAVDDTFRTCISAFSDLHFVAAEPFKQKLVSMGIRPNKIVTSGAPSLEKIKTLSLMRKEDFLTEAKLMNTPETDEIRLQEAIQGILDSHEERFIVVAFNPVTRLSDLGRQERDALIEAIKDLPIQLILSLGFADPGCLEFNEAFEELWKYRDKRDVLLRGSSIHQYIYYLTHAQMIIGNSSSGLIEAPFLKTPSINVGIRQKGRLSSSTTLHVPAEKDALLQAIQKAGTLEWKNKVRADASPYGNGTATRKIIPVIRKWLIEKYPDIQQ